jgi:hypothetical protein
LNEKELKNGYENCITYESD